LEGLRALSDVKKGKDKEAWMRPRSWSIQKRKEHGTSKKEKGILFYRRQGLKRTGKNRGEGK